MYFPKSSGSKFLILVLLFEPVGGAALAAPFRLSFLDQEPVLANTCQLLKQSGVSEDAIVTFRKLVTDHHKIGNPADRTKFPPPQNGFYEFEDCGDLARRLQHPLCQPPPTNTPAQTLLCYDLVALLLTGAGYGAPCVEQDFQSKGIVIPQDGTLAKPADYQTFRSFGCGLAWPEKYYPKFLGRPRTEAETRLLLSLSAAYGLTDKDSDSEKSLRAAFAARFNGLKRDGLVFTSSFQVGLVSMVKRPAGFIKADHAFICIPLKGRLICLEKRGPRGPYIRAEFCSEEDVGRYACLSYQCENYPVVVSLNDKFIGVYRPAIPR